MKSLKILFPLLCLSLMGEAQSKTMWWGGMPVDKVVNESEIIFEGRILTDSVFFQNPPGEIYTYHHVLVLKQFKGEFKSDTLIVVNIGGVMPLNGMLQGESISYAHKGDEAVFLAVCGQHIKFGINDPNVYYFLYGPGVGYVTPCNKKDVVKEVYEPIEAVTGQKYIDVHPNTCATQQKK